MSEEAVRQTRSQKRALEREAAPQCTEPNNDDSETKKPKLDSTKPTAETQIKPTPDAVLAQGEKSPRKDESEPEKEQSRSPKSLVSPLISQPEKDDLARTQKHHTVELNSDCRTDSSDRDNKERTETTMDTRSLVRPIEPKVASGMLAADEVKATIKVEVQTGEQPVDMSTSRG